MGSASNIKAGGAYVVIGADDRDLQRALGNIRNRFAGMSAVVSNVGRAMFAAGAAITTPLATAAVMAANAGAQLYDMSRRTGISASALSSFGVVAKLTSTDLETVEAGVRKMQKAIVSAGEGSKESADALARLGISVESLRGLTPEEQFRKISGAIASIQDPTARAAETMKIFGKSGTALLPMIEQLGALEATAKRLGLVKTDEQARQAKEMAMAFELSSMAVKSLWATIGEALFPTLKSAAALFIRATVAVRPFVKEHQPAIVTAFKLGSALIAAGAGFLVVGKALSLVSSAAGGISSVFTVVRAGIGLVGSFVTTIGAVPVALAGVAAYLLYTSGVGQTMLKALGGYFGDLKDTAMEAFGGIKNALAAGDWALAAQIAWAGLKLAWEQGIQPLKVAWEGLKNFGLTLWEDIGDGITKAVFFAIAEVKKAWADMKAWVLNLWEDLGNEIATNDIESKHRGKMLGIDYFEKNKLITPEEAAKRRAAEQAQYDQDRRIAGQSNKAAHAQYDSERDAAVSAANAEYKARKDLAEAEHQANLARINKESKDAIQAAQDEVDKRKKDLEDLTKKAKQEAAKASKDRFGVLPAAPSLGSVPGLNPDELEGVMKATRAAGTFSARGAFGLAARGDAGVGAKQLSVLEKMANDYAESKEINKEGLNLLKQGAPWKLTN